jgi:hypothetical protein
MNLGVNGERQSRREVILNLYSYGHPPLRMHLYFGIQLFDLLRSFLSFLSESLAV